MFKWLKRNRDRSQSESAETVRIAGSVEEEEAAVAAQPCECGGTLRIKNRLSRQESGQILHDMALECEECFQPHRWTFRFEGDPDISYDSDSDSNDERDFRDHVEDELRLHHYTFAHRILPQIVFDDPDAFFEVMSAGHSAAALEALWHRVGEQTGQPVITPQDVPALSVWTHEFLGRLGVVVGLPEPRGMTEAWYIAVISDNRSIGEPWRYLVFENTDRIDENPRAILCEWFADGSRQNHRQTDTPTFENMVGAVERHLSLEEKRRSAGMETAVSPRWQPGHDPDGPPMFNAGTYRLGLCQFSFHELPEALANHLDSLVRAFQGGDGLAFLKALWSSGHSRNAIKIVIPQNVYVAQIGTENYVVIQMPEPLAPPEPYLIGFALPTNNLTPRIYTLEMSSENQEELPFLCRIDSTGSHAIIGQTSITSEEQFAELIARAEKKQLGPLNPGNTLMHLMLYAEISSKTKESE